MWQKNLPKNNSAKSCYLAILVFLVFIWPKLALAQAGGAFEVSLHVDGENYGDFFGRSVDFIGDLDGDGLPDIVVGADTADPGGITSAGSVFVHSSVTGNLLLRVDGSFARQWLGWPVAGAGDVNLDGIPDFIAGASGWIEEGFFGAAFVYSGADGSVIHKLLGNVWFGRAVDGGHDVNGDGYPDLLVGAGLDSILHLYANSGSAWVFSGKDGSVLHHYEGTHSFMRLGYSVSFGGDFDHDGVSDLLIGASGANVGEIESAGKVFIYSGATGMLLLELQGTDDFGAFGTDVCSIPDTNQDGYPEILIGAELEEINEIHGVGYAYLCSGKTGEVLFTFPGIVGNSWFGHAVACAGDLNGDGISELLVSVARTGGPNLEDGMVRLFSGADGTLLWEHSGNSTGDIFGEDVAAGEDVTGDGIPDLLVGAPQFGFLQGGPGYVEILSVDPFLRIDTSSLSVDEGGVATLDIDFPDSEAGYAYAVLASLSGPGPSRLADLLIPLSQDHFYQQMLNGQAPAAFENAYGSLDANGNASASYTLPAGTSATWVGRRLYLAAISYAPGQPRLASAPVSLRARP
ncbi:MAG: hypothetical protein DWQ01_22155 [Planctomycetota bacterium]|nr:MAG: hypothetical protein DWQ01_22155 [Planctomycetota bacterium]